MVKKDDDLQIRSRLMNGGQAWIAFPTQNYTHGTNEITNASLFSALNTSIFETERTKNRTVPNSSNVKRETNGTFDQVIVDGQLRESVPTSHRWLTIDDGVKDAYRNNIDKLLVMEGME